MSITNPTQLVEEFKKSGEFDRLRRELLKEFRQSEGVAAFLARVEDIAKQKLASDPKLQYMPEANVSREIMQELDRCAVVLPDRPAVDRTEAIVRFPGTHSWTARCKTSLCSRTPPSRPQ
ncbi:hypothetical protein C8Q76DRAFT_722846 [Earliella scabrosa]|nr:hypothetical protein C8Q76DRAFT_722846 [Earliella scabrosa]